VKSILHRSARGVERRTVSVDVWTPRGPVTIALNTTVISHADTRSIVTVGSIAQKTLTIAYLQHLTSKRTDVTITLPDGTTTHTVESGLIGYDTSDNGVRETVAEISRDHASHRQLTREQSPRQVATALSAQCGGLCAPFLLMEGVGFAVCYLSCLAATSGE
jgi:hypothetical protein